MVRAQRQTRRHVNERGPLEHLVYTLCDDDQWVLYNTIA